MEEPNVTTIVLIQPFSYLRRWNSRFKSLKLILKLLKKVLSFGYLVDTFADEDQILNLSNTRAYSCNLAYP